VAALVLVALGVLYVWSSERWFAVDRTSRHATLSGEAVRPTVAPAQTAREILSGSLLPALVRMASSRYSLAGAQS
jgi:hypothetical protein